jgi:hypothetical protein
MIKSDGLVGAFIALIYDNSQTTAQLFDWDGQPVDNVDTRQVVQRSDFRRLHLRLDAKRR